MIKLLALSWLLITMFAAKAQTKDETIEWLNTNGPILLTVNNKIGLEDHQRTFVEVKNDSLHLYEKHDCNCSNGFSTVKYHYFIPVKSILFQDVNSLIKKEKDQFAWFILQLLPNTKIKYTRNNEWSQEDASTYNIYYSKEEEANAKRVLKAIMNLAKLSGAKINKQTF